MIEFGSNGNDIKAIKYRNLIIFVILLSYLISRLIAHARATFLANHL